MWKHKQTVETRNNWSHWRTFNYGRKSEWVAVIYDGCCYRWRPVSSPPDGCDLLLKETAAANLTNVRAMLQSWVSGCFSGWPPARTKSLGSLVGASLDIASQSLCGRSAAYLRLIMHAYYPHIQINRSMKHFQPLFFPVAYVPAPITQFRGTC